jgi:FGGY-family pentulose kinase
LGGRPVVSAALNRRLALIGGTSSCQMTVSRRPRFIGGIWGPYYSAMIPGWWLTEGGQSATGALIDHVVMSQSSSAGLAREAKKDGSTIYEFLNARLVALARAGGLSHPAELTRDFHIQPDFHGNRSPRSDPTLRGIMAGLPLSATTDDLALQYLAAIQAVAYGTRHIIEEMNRGGYRIDTVLACGGGTKNPLFLREHADITGCRIVLPKEPEAVLLGSAVLGAVAAGRFPRVLTAMAAMNHAGRVIDPAHGRVARYHHAKYKIFHRLHADFLGYRKLMERYVASVGLPSFPF